ncbi:unnamed protein product [Dovyalis caffra]|uniref:Uncharacterized protein n=1 Tax=Dovyalis caffra TaxID=77055 RepID=A0AAV1QLC5_9ROSI|nr:unnamed protein product [Dovyalis caffra]
MRFLSGTGYNKGFWVRRFEQIGLIMRWVKYQNGPNSMNNPINELNGDCRIAYIHVASSENKNGKKQESVQNGQLVFKD